MASGAPAGQLGALVSNCPLGPYLPPSVTRLFMGLTLWERQMLNLGQFSVLLMPPMKNHQDFLLDASFQVPELPSSTQGVREVQLRKSLGFALGSQKTSYSPTSIRSIIKYWSLLTQPKKKCFSQTEEQMKRDSHFGAMVSTGTGRSNLGPRVRNPYSFSLFQHFCLWATLNSLCSGLATTLWSFQIPEMSVTLRLLLILFLIT